MKTTYILAIEVCFCCSSMKPGIFMEVEVRNWRLSIENGLFVDAVDWICCLSMKPGIFMDVEVRN